MQKWVRLENIYTSKVLTHCLFGNIKNEKKQRENWDNTLAHSTTFSSPEPNVFLSRRSFRTIKHRVRVRKRKTAKKNVGLWGREWLYHRKLDRALLVLSEMSLGTRLSSLSYPRSQCLRTHASPSNISRCLRHRLQQSYFMLAVKEPRERILEHKMVNRSNVEDYSKFLIFLILFSYISYGGKCYRKYCQKLPWTSGPWQDVGWWHRSKFCWFKCLWYFYTFFKNWIFYLVLKMPILWLFAIKR